MRTPRQVVVVLLIGILSGCSTRGAYEGLRANARLTCENQPGSSREQCEVRNNRDDYDTYEKKRRGN